MNTPVSRYLSVLRARARKTAALDRLASPPPDSLAALHQQLAAHPQPVRQEEDAPLASVKARLTMRWPEAVSEDDPRLCDDSQARTQLRAGPPVKRAVMSPDEPWKTGLCRRMWEGLTGRSVPPKKPVDDALKGAAKKWRLAGTVRRYILLLLMLVQTSVATWYMKTILPYQGWDLLDPIGAWQQGGASHLFWQSLPYVLEALILVLFAILFCWVSAGFWTALMGFLQLLIGRDRYSISASAAGDAPIDPRHRTALIMPICNEDVARVFAGLRATWESVVATGQQAHFDVYILSDSYDPDICIAEQRAWLTLCAETGARGQIFYRRRRRRVKRKSGNIDDFCRRWGSQYSYMVILDADSVMSGTCLTTLVRLMEANPGAGIIQTAPRASGMNTLYARCQQFATRVYGPLFTAGLHFWQLGESHYWGHNAIIRIQPFMDHCALAPLPGEGAFSGAILSHDFVEAALMRRAGWGVWIAYDLPGSYEELPPNLLDELKRDRRWCHGNLMNFRLFWVRGMHPVHRAVFLTGVMSYLSAPLWFLFLLLSTALQTVYKLVEPQYFLQQHQLYPVWPQWRPELAIALFSTTLVLLFLPKLLSVILIWCKGSRQYGGPCRLLLSMLLEMLFSVLLAPVRMLFHTVFVLSAFLGWSVQWKSPQRDDDATSWGEAWRRHGSQVLLGSIWAAGIAWLDLRFLYWFAPIVVSLIVSPWVSVLTSRTAPGLSARRHRLFLIPEEVLPPAPLAATVQYTQQNQRTALTTGFIRALIDPAYNALACALATARHGVSPLIEAGREAQVYRVLQATPATLPADAALRVIDDPVVLARLHYQLWRQPAKWPVWFDALAAQTDEATAEKGCTDEA